MMLLAMRRWMSCIVRCGSAVICSWSASRFHSPRLNFRKIVDNPGHVHLCNQRRREAGLIRMKEDWPWTFHM
ncbi:hypothetical protein EDC04DRAFT_2774074 [Pisolithus marmoratus]|nr:hypothetical protein EDC04DRAFT_2774074 [Pisolithus marmoratus]